MTGTESTSKRAVLQQDASRQQRNAVSDDRLGRFYVTWRSSAMAMLLRAFGSQLDEHAREDAYSSAWAASLSSLGSRIEGMSDAELRTYLFAAVTTHAGKELRRRGRKPVHSLEDSEPAGPGDDEPSESLLRLEDRRVLHDVLSSLPDRRRRVITLRYAVGLTPEEICEVIDGLSPRAYRKEITKGIRDLADRMGLVERGEWCASLEQEIRAFASGEASANVQDQARAHLSHCASCAKAVRELSGSLHDLSLIPATGLLAEASLGDGGVTARFASVFDQLKQSASSLVSRAGDGEAALNSISASGGTRGGATAVVAGVGAKLGALGAAGKVALGCVGATAGMAACVAAGTVPVGPVEDLLTGHAGAEREARDEHGADQGDEVPTAWPVEPAPTAEAVDTISDHGDQGARSAPDPQPDASAARAPDSANESAAPVPVIAPESVTPIERETAPEVAASTTDDSSSAGGGQNTAGRATSDQATAQLGTP